MKSALQPLSNGNVTNANMTVTLGAGAADIDFSSPACPRGYMGAKLRVIDSAGRSIYGFVYTDGAGNVQNIVNAKGGSTRNWTVQETDFDDDDDGGYKFQLSRTPPVVVASGTVLDANFKVDLSADNAYVELVGVDLTPYQDGRHLIAIYDHSYNYGLLGHISDTAPLGETLGLELIVAADDRTFDSDTGWWDLGVGWEITGGKSVFTASHYNMKREAFLTAGAYYKVIGTYTITDSYLYLQAGLEYKKVYAGVGRIDYISCNRGITCGYASLVATGTVDDVSWKRVTDIAATGALIVSTQADGIRSWYYKNGYFQGDTSYDYKIYFIGN